MAASNDQASAIVYAHRFVWASTSRIRSPQTTNLPIWLPGHSYHLASGEV